MLSKIALNVHGAVADITPLSYMMLHVTELIYEYRSVRLEYCGEFNADTDANPHKALS